MKLLLLLAYFSVVCTFGQPKNYDPQNSEGDLYQYAEYIDIGNSELSFEELHRKRMDYLPISSENHSIGFTDHHIWVRFSIQNSSDENKTYYLETGRPVTDVAELYHITNSSYSKFLSGDQISFSDRQVAHRSTVFKFTLARNSINTFYLHLNSDGETLNIPLKLSNESTFWQDNYQQQLFMGIFYGLLLLAGIIYLFFFNSLKERTFLYYGLYVFSIALMQAALDGFLFQYIFSEGGYLNSRIVLITALLSNFFLLKYCQYFVRIKTTLPSFNNFYNLIYGVIGVLFLMILINDTTLYWYYRFSNVNGLISLLLILSSIFVLRFRKIKVDIYFSLGVFFLVIGLLGFVMNNLSLLPNNFYVLNSAKFGTGLEVIFLSLSMTNLIRRLRIEKETSQLEALRRSEEISQLKTYFMSNVSHELRTPINAIMGISEAELAENNSYNSSFELIRNASLSLLGRVNDILDFENIEKNELVLRSEKFNLKMLFDKLCSTWQEEAIKKRLSFSVKREGILPDSVIGDSERVLQIFNHLLSNAVKFTENGGIEVFIFGEITSEEIVKVSVEVKDTGVGISKELQPYVFDSFSQMRLDHKRQFGGLGLGLTIVKHLVKLFGGQLALDSSPEFGTNISVSLPMKFQPQSFIKNEKPTNLNVNRQLHVLIVEDNAMNRLVMKKILKQLNNATIDEAINGKEAIELAINTGYDLILMDLQMPVMDGYEATKIIRSGDLNVGIKDVPILAVTADATNETRLNVLELGMNDLITKPVDKNLLFQKIESLTSTYNCEDVLSALKQS